MIIDKINSIAFNEKNINELISKMKFILEKLELCKDTKEIIKLIDSFNKLRDKYLTLYWCSYLGYLKDITDTKYLESESIFSTVDNKYNNLIYRYYGILNRLRDNYELVKILGKRTFDIASNQSILLSDKNKELVKREKELCMKYRKLIMSIKFEFNGEVINISKLSKYFSALDINLRKKAHDKRYEILISISNELDLIIDELINVREEIAINLGFNNYHEYGFVKMNRIGYTKEDISLFRDKVIKYIVPLYNKVIELQKMRLGKEKVDYYDSDYLFNEEFKIDIKIEDLINIYRSIYKELDFELYQIFDLVESNGLIDLEDRENKSNGGLATYLPEYRLPTFIKKYMGTIDNITSINHELGHIFQLYLSRDLLYHENRWPTFDICEIHSSANELLLYPYMGNIFGDNSNKYFIYHLTHLISILIRMCMIDEFQENIYRNPKLSSIERRKLWSLIYKKYFPNNNYSHEYFNLGIEWQYDINRIDDPFYGIDYSISSICAISFYKKMLEDKDRAIKEYKTLCKDGGTLSLIELIDKYNLFNPFDEFNIKSLSVFLDNEIKKLTKIRK